MRIGVKNMRTIEVIEDAVLIAPVMRIAGNMVALVDDQNALPMFGSQNLRRNRACKPSADNQPIMNFFKIAIRKKFEKTDTN